MALSRSAKRRQHTLVALSLVEKKIEVGGGVGGIESNYPSGANTLVSSLLVSASFFGRHRCHASMPW